MRASFYAILIITVSLCLTAGCREPDARARATPTPRPRGKIAGAIEPAVADEAAGSSWGEELASLRPVEAAIPWREWTLRLNDWGNIQDRRITGDGATLDQYDELVVLEQIAGRNPKPANPWAAVFSLATAADMVRVDLDGTRYLETSGTSLNQTLYAEEAYDTYMRQALAYSRGNLRIDNIRRDPDEPFTAEYRGGTAFWPGGDHDIGRDLDTLSFDSMNGLWFPGPIRPRSRGSTFGGFNWGYNAGQTTVQFAPGREVGRRISDISHIMLHEWLHQIAGMKWWLGYYGLPGQYEPGNYNAGSHLYFQRYIITPRMWRVMHSREPQTAAPNKPKSRHAGYILDWLVLGEFEGRDRDAIADDFIRQVWTNIQIQGRALSKEELNFPESEVQLLPDEGDTLLDKKWRRHKPGADLNNVGHYDGELDSVFLRRDGSKGDFPVPRKDVFIYAHTYVWSPEAQDAIIWAGGAEPFQLYLNGEECFRIGRGTYQDGASRNVRLRKGWNRVLVQKMDQAARNWSFSVKFTDRERNDLPALKVSAAKPKDLDGDTPLDEPAILRVDAEQPCVEPITLPLKYYSWEGEVADDWWGALPILNEQHFEALFGQTGVRIEGGHDLTRPVSGPDRSTWDKTLFVDVSGLDGILSRVAPERDAYDFLLNNLMNQAIETTALIRYTHPATGKPRDLLFVRIDMVEPFVELVEVDDARPLKDSIIGYILRDTKQAVVFETWFGDRLPSNEVGLLSLQGRDITLRAWPSVPRVIRGEPLMLSVEAAYLKGRDEGVPDLEDVRLRLAEQAAVETADTTRYRDERERVLPSLKPGEAVMMEAEIDTKALAPGIVTYAAAVTYTKDGETRTETRPLPVNVFNPVDLTLNIDGSSLFTEPRASAYVVVHNNLDRRARGTVRLVLPDGWQASPAKQSFKLGKRDDEVRLEFKLTLPPGAASTTYVLRATAAVGAARGITSEGAHQVQVALGDALVSEDFEHGIPSDFGHAWGLYNVVLVSDEDGTPVAFKGSTCLRVRDSGGARYGNVQMFGTDRFWPAGRRKPHTTYTYDTNDYPIIEWWMRSDGRDANLGLHVILDTDRRQKRYGVLLHGLWEQQWDYARQVGTVDFPTDKRWHRITINLDELLDGYLGNEPHRVAKVSFGDTRGFASGWWFDAHKYTHYIDEFSVRKARAGERTGPPAIQAAGEGADRPPAFVATPSNGLQLVVRPRDIGYKQLDQILLDGWLTSLIGPAFRVARYPREARVAVRLVDESGADVFDDQEGGWLVLNPLPKEPPKEPNLNEFFELKAGETARWTPHAGGAVRIDEALKRYFEKKSGSRTIPAGTYQITAKYIQDRWSDAETGSPTWQGEVISNSATLVIEPAPTREELLAQLKGPYERTRAQAVTALYRYKHSDALPDIVGMLEDTDAGVRLNAAFAIGEFAREQHRRALEQVRNKFRKAELKDEAVADLAALNKTWDPAVVALVKALDDENRRVGEYAGFALAKLGDVRGIEPLTRRLTNPSPYIRRRTADALAEYRLHMPADANDEAGQEAAAQAAVLAFERLLAATDNEMPSTRLFAYRAAKRFIGRPEWGSPEETVQADAFDAAIRKAFGDTYWVIHADATAWAAGRTETDFSNELAAQVTAHDWSVRERLAGRLADLANKRAQIAVKKAREDAKAQEQEFTDEQAAALVLQAKEPYIATIKQLLEDGRIQVRWAAVKALHKLGTGKTIEELTGHDARTWRTLTN